MQMLGIVVHVWKLSIEKNWVRKRVSRRLA